MAWKFDQAIVRGELDNTEQGRVQLRLEILGRAEPLLFDLVGDAWRDIAGSRLRFSNPTPKRQFKIPTTSGVQAGWVGDITATRKVKVFTVPEDEWRQAYRDGSIDSVPTEMRNSLYLEWFTVEDGRCVVESADFETEVIEHSWQMDEDEEAAQKLANMHAMREYLAGIIQRPPRPEDGEYDDELRQEDFTEEKWEQQLKASDRLEMMPAWRRMTNTSRMTTPSGRSPLSWAGITSSRTWQMPRRAWPFRQGTTYFPHGYTFGGHPVSAAVASANLDILEREGLYDHVRSTPPVFRAALESLLDIPIVGDVRGEGFFYGIELVKDRTTRETFDEAESERLLRGFLSKALFDADLYCRADDRGDPVVQLAPPLIIGQSEIDEITSSLPSVLTEAWNRL